MTLRLDFSIGPVQGFVAQSRRTRDLWGSSYMLSFLSAHAMYGACRVGGRIVQPVVDDDPLFLWISNTREGSAPRLGSVPNHFVLEFEGDPSDVAQGAIDALEAAWERVCQSVWKHFVEHAQGAGEGTQEIWNRQTVGFWEIMWTAGDISSPSGLLARRKHWRSHRLPDEPGDKCTVMHDFQELSGYVRAENHTSREKQDAFWSLIREKVGPLDLRVDERLCAIALVKRLFPKVARSSLGWDVDTSHWPSTVHVASIPWIRRVNTVASEQAYQYAETVKEYAPAGALSERLSSCPGLDEYDSGDFCKLDANYYHREFLSDERLCPLADGAPSDAREKLVHLLSNLQCSMDEAGLPIGPSPSFYALLLADGDRLGKLVGSLGGKRVSRALADFTASVQQIVREHDGFTVYAGGDDVLSMLPVSSALSCAQALADRFAGAFEDIDPQVYATLSVGIVFAHVRIPLGAVLNEAHRLLDAVAKDANGRNSLAVGLLKRGGIHSEWVTTWTRQSPGFESLNAVDILQKLVAHLKCNATKPGLSSGLIYRIRDTLSLLCGWPQWAPGVWGALPPALDIRAFLQAEVLRSLMERPAQLSSASAAELTDLLWRLLHPSRMSNGSPNSDNSQAGVDAYLLARFLAAPAYKEDEA